MRLRSSKRTELDGGAPPADDPPASPAFATPRQPQPKKQRTPSSSTKKKTPQDIGITHLLLGAPLAQQPAAEAVAVVPDAPAVAEAMAAVPPALPVPPPHHRPDALVDEAALQRACGHLAAVDPKLAALIAEHGVPVRLLAKGGSTAATIAKSICFQQLATAAAAAIYNRVLAACGCANILTPAAILAAAVPDLRAAGLSGRKVEYLRDLAQHFVSGQLSDAGIYSWDDATLHRELTKVRGLGDWSVDMFAMFHLGHADILPTGDLGVHFGLSQLPTPAQMAALTEAWRPYRSVGCYYMWRIDVPRSMGQGKGKRAKKKRTDDTDEDDQ